MLNLNPGEIHVLRHALGLSGSNRTTYRNRYLAGGQDIVTWRSLVKRGLAREGEAEAGAVWFMATRAGFLAVAKKAERLGRDEDAAFKRMEASAT
jgi:hypothetical protein